MNGIGALAPSGETVVDYDRRNLSLYAALLDAADAGEDWEGTAWTLMQLDANDPQARACWHSHLERARWIVSDGLESAIVAFNARSFSITITV